MREFLKTCILFCLFGILAGAGKAQTIHTEDEERSHWMEEEDSVEKTDIPIEVKMWRIDERFGDVRPIEADTASHLFQNQAFTEGLHGEYNTTGNLGSPRQARIFGLRRATMMQDPFIFSQPFDFFVKEPDEYLFTNTKSPFTNLTYHSCGNKTNGEDRISALFGVNAGKKLGVGFKLDYLYGRGYYQRQGTAHLNGAVFASYRDDRYDAHLIYYANHLKNAENGGIDNDEYITNPENFPTKYGTADMPVNLTRAVTKLNVNSFFLTHRYNIGFNRYRDQNGNIVKSDRVKSILGMKNLMKLPADSLAADSAKLLAAADSAKTIAQLDTADINEEDADSITLTPEFVPVSSVIHTFRADHNNRRFISSASGTADEDYFRDFYWPTATTDERIKYLNIANTVAIDLHEGFNKWMVMGLRLFAKHELQHYTLPSSAYESAKTIRNYFTVGAQLLRRNAKIVRYNVLGELRTTGKEWGEFNVEGDASLNIPFLKDTLHIIADGYVRNEQPSFFYEHFHGRNASWDKSLDMEFRTRIGGAVKYKDTRLSFHFETIQNYTTFAETLEPYSDEDGLRLYRHSVQPIQTAKNLRVTEASISQDFHWGVFNWENEVTYQRSSNEDILPLPMLNIYSNLYLKFKIAKVLSTEIGGDVRYFTKYYAPTYSPIIGQFALQDATERIKLGNYPIINVYANFHLKRTRFYVMASHVNGSTGSGMPFLAPHYPMNLRIIRFGISWNFFN